MGAWGAGNFENDEALDFVGELDGANTADPLLSVFKPVIEASRKGEEIEAGDACRVLAAAELIAAARGWPPEYFPPDAEAYVKTIAPPDTALVQQASEAVSCVLLNSELLELWEESDEVSEWNKVATGLIERLGAPQRKLKSKKEPKDPLLSVVCSFCTDQIRESALVELSLKRPDDSAAGAIERSIFAHVECLNSKLHPRHIVQFWRMPQA